jgi:hypothetical protein
MSNVTHATKPAKGKSAAKKPAAPKTAAAKTAPAKGKGASKKPSAPKAVVRPSIGFTITNRPSSGVVLFAYTEAALDLLGMHDGVAVPASTIKKIMGATALRYHLDKQTFAQDDSGKVTLTGAGKAFFAERKVRAQADHVEMFKTMMVSGTIAGALYKNDDQVVAIQA